MNKKITDEQIKKLFAFCIKEEIYEYDIQIEVVDHLASAIEDQWTKNPDLTFGWAFRNISLKFGKNGFRKLERKIIRQTRHKYNRLLLNYFIDFFRIPKIIITLAFLLVLFTILQTVQNNMWVIMPICILLSVGSVVYHYKIFPQKFDIINTKKTFMLLEYLKNINAKAGSVAQLPFIALIFSNGFRLKYSNDLWSELIISTVLTGLLLFFYAHFVLLPSKIKNYFVTNYPEFAK